MPVALPALSVAANAGVVVPSFAVPVALAAPTIALGRVVGLPPRPVPVVLIPPVVTAGGEATANAADMAFYTYVADDGSLWAVKVDKTWGENPDSGAEPWTPGLPTIAKRSNAQARRIMLQDPVSGRVTGRVVFKPTAAAWVTPGYGTAIPIRGAAGLVPVQLVERRPEWIPRPRTIISKPEVVTTP